MREDLNTIKRNLHLSQSELFSEVYEKSTQHTVHTFNEVSIFDVDDWFNSLITKYGFLNKQQIENVRSFFKKMKYVLKNIDPNKLNIENDLIEELDLVLWRESNKGISKLVFDEYGQIIYMFNGNDGRKVKGVFDSNVDMEKLLYKFIE
jgi:K+ transporter